MYPSKRSSKSKLVIVIMSNTKGFQLSLKEVCLGQESLYVFPLLIDLVSQIGVKSARLALDLI